MSTEDQKSTIVRKMCTACGREYSGTDSKCPSCGHALMPTPQDIYLNQQIADKYRIVAVIGTGGMGVVYQAHHDLMQRDVAIKMLRAQYITDKTSVKRFTQEAIAVGRLHHPHVVTTYDHGFTSQGQPYLVMDFLKGRSLAEIISAEKQISVERAIHIFAQACDALDHAHQRGVIHRDLKPGNIMLIHEHNDPDFVKVLDFGVAQLNAPNGEKLHNLTQVGEVCGSPAYMSPEQCLDKPLDRRADIYSMGVVLYEALTGKAPHMGASMVETMTKHITDEPVPPTQLRPDLYIPPRLEHLVIRTLNKDPDLRPQSMALFRQELLLCVPPPASAQALRNLGPEKSSAKKKNENKSGLAKAIIAAVIAVIIGGIIIAFIAAQKQPATPSQRTVVPTTTNSEPVKSTAPKAQPTEPIKTAPIVAVQQPALPKIIKPFVVSKITPKKEQIRTQRISHTPRYMPKIEAVHYHSAPQAASDPFARLGSHRSYTQSK